MGDRVPAENRRTEAQGRAERIRVAAEETWRLLLEAYNGRDWEVLGYGSWAGYCEREFGMTDRNARYLLGQGEVITEIEAAIGVELPPGTISRRAAMDVKPALAAVVDEVAVAVKGKRKTERPAIAAAVVEEHRQSGTAVPLPPEKPKQDKGSAPPRDKTSSAEPPPAEPTQAQRFAALVPRVLKLDVAEVAIALGPPGESGSQAEALRKWAERLESEAKGYAKTRRDATRGSAS